MGETVRTCRWLGVAVVVWVCRVTVLLGSARSLVVVVVVNDGRNLVSGVGFTDSERVPGTRFDLCFCRLRHRFRFVSWVSPLHGLCLSLGKFWSEVFLATRTSSYVLHKFGFFLSCEACWCRSFHIRCSPSLNSLVHLPLCVLPPARLAWSDARRMRLVLSPLSFLR